MDYRVEQAIVLMKTNLKSGIRVDWLARQLGVSTSHLQHLFKNQTGTILLRYQQRIRIDQARMLLEQTNLSIKQIVSEVGGSDLSQEHKLTILWAIKFNSRKLRRRRSTIW